jgi:hypothetical protein
MGKIAKDEFLVLCDDIRDEAGNKRSLMGIYSDNIIFKSVPAALPKICLYIALRGIKRDFKSIHIRTRFPKTKSQSFEIKELPPINLGKNVSLGIIVSPFKTEAQGNARFEICFDDDDKPSLIYKFTISVGE